MKRVLNRLVKEQKGVSLIQMALVMPVLLALITGIFELGIVNSYWDALHDIKGTTIRAMAKNGGMNDTILAWVQDQLRTAGIDPAEVTIRATWEPVQRNEMVEVEFTYPYRFVLFGAKGSNIGFNINLTAKGVAMSEKYFRP
ncbi:TadE-like protein (plasmid) [Carboxydocella thermautotrophica]|nr:TadE-like protein [Carboxydocella thermautotrophica]